jgi:hypothetical protein
MFDPTSTMVTDSLRHRQQADRADNSAEDAMLEGLSLRRVGRGGSDSYSAGASTGTLYAPESPRARVDDVDEMSRDASAARTLHEWDLSRKEQGVLGTLPPAFSGSVSQPSLKLVGSSSDCGVRKPPAVPP